MEEERRLTGSGLGGAATNEALAKAEGRPLLHQAALVTTTVGGTREWSREWRIPRDPPDVWPRPQVLSVGLSIITNGRRV